MIVVHTCPTCGDVATKRGTHCGRQRRRSYLITLRLCTDCGMASTEKTYCSGCKKAMAATTTIVEMSNGTG